MTKNTPLNQYRIYGGGARRGTAPGVHIKGAHTHKSCSVNVFKLWHKNSVSTITENGPKK